MKSKMLKNITVASLVALMLVGCAEKPAGSNSDAESNNGGNSATGDSGYAQRLVDLGFTGTKWLEDGKTKVVTEPIEYTVMGNSHSTLLGTAEDWAVNTFFTDLTDWTGVGFDFETITPNGKEWKEKMPTMFATDKLPEVFFKALFTRDQLVEYGCEEQMLLDLKPYIDEYMPNLKALLEKHPEVEAAWTAPDGGIYALSSIKEESLEKQTFRINKVWLDELGLKDPKTADELYNVLKAFKEKDPNGNGTADEVPLVFQGVGNMTEMLNFFGLPGNIFNPSGAYLFLDDDKEIKFMPTMDEFKEFLTFAEKLYSEGLMDPDSFTLSPDEIKANNSGKDAVYGMYNSNNPFGTGLSQLHPDGSLEVETEIRNADYQYLAPLTPDNGRDAMSNGGMGTTVGNFALSYKCENPEPFLVMLDYLYTKEGGEKVWGGTEGETFRYDENGAMKWLSADGKDAIGTAEADIRRLNTIQPGGSQFCLEPASQAFPPVDAQTQNIDNIRYTGRVAVPGMFFAEDNAKTIATIIADIVPVVDVYIADVVTGKKDIDSSYDAFIKELEAVGVEDLVSLYNARYNELF